MPLRRVAPTTNGAKRASSARNGILLGICAWTGRPNPLKDWCRPNADRRSGEGKPAEILGVGKGLSTLDR